MKPKKNTGSKVTWRFIIFDIQIPRSRLCWSQFFTAQSLYLVVADFKCDLRLFKLGRLQVTLKFATIKETNHSYYDCQYIVMD